MRELTCVSVAAALQAASEWLSPRLNIAEVLIVGATHAAADEFARSAGADGSLGLRRTSLVQLAAELAAPALAERGLAPVTRLGSEAIAARAIHKLHKAKKLDYFNRVAKYPGFPGALATTLTDLRLAGAKAPKGDLKRLLTEYERELEARGLADLAQIFELASRVPVTLPILLLDVPLATRSHQDFAASLSRHSIDLFSISIDAAPGEPARARTALEHARNFLFSTERPPAVAADQSLEVFSAPGEGLEAVEIARRIRLMSVPFDRVAILLRSPERYQFLIEEALRRAGIPSYFSRGSARPDPAGRAFLALLHCANEDSSATRFAEYLSLGQTPQSPSTPEWTPPEDELLPLFAWAEANNGAATAPEPDAPSIATPIAWEKLLVDAAVIGGRDRWARRLRGLEEEFCLQLAVQPDERTERQLEKLRNLERFALPLIETLCALPKSGNWDAWLSALRQLAASSLRQPESVLAALAELEPMSGIGPVEIDEVLQVLSERLRFLRRDPPHRRYGRVFVGAIEEARGRSFDVVFLPGLAEGVFPRRTFEDPLMLDSARRALSDALPIRDDRTEDERTLLRIALAAAEKRFVYSYPSMDIAQGRPRVPSLYALELARAAEGRVPRLQEFERRTAGNAEARLVWPAPADPSHAIDNAEYDLAWHAGHQKQKGSSRYLIEESPSLARSLRTRWKRWDRKWSDADGLVAPDTATRALLHNRRLAVRAYSPTALQTFAACPYKFFLHGVYGLRPREDVAALEQMDPLTRGALFHAVQFEFFAKWREHRYSELQPALDALDDCLKSVAVEYKEKLAPAIDRVWSSEIEALSADLRGWLRLWFESQKEWEPVLFEYAFGLDRRTNERHDPASVTQAAVLPDGTLVRGSIDLVERHRTRGVLRVTDHKTGKPPAQQPASIGGGAVMQPVLYGLTVESLLGTDAEEGRLFFCTQRGSFTPVPVPLTAPTRDRFHRALEIIDDAIEAGFLPAAPQKDACKMCDYTAICGPYEEQRVRAFKPKDDLEPLLDIRRMP